ncbi:transglutaminase-like domain-containing protein [Mesorhizobium cantuariense]|uniref:Transglutaminase family protein n=1 Tax=Mesorhizobium cantuariense TaxID=1300275 RepID=A0ABV7N1Z7_9HYPH
MRIHIGCEMSFDFPQETPLIAMLNVHYSRASDLERPDFLISNPPVPIESYRDSFGNWCNRFVAPPGRFTFGTDAVIRDPGTFEMGDLMAWQHEVRDLPADTLLFLLPSRFCESDLLASEAWRLFGHTPLGIPRVQAVCDFVHNHIVFNYGNARPTRTAAEAYREQSGVCRDYAHLAVTFCRALNIPTRYCTGYISDIGMPKPWASMDFCAWMEVYLGGRWHVFDPRNNAPRIGRILIASGRDAADVPLTHIFGPGTLAGFKVWTSEIVD